MKNITSLLLLFTLILFAPLDRAEAFGFNFKDSQGKTHTLSNYKGKWVLVNFWATWCPPCLKEIPDLAALFRERKDIMVIGIAMDYDDTDVVMDYVENLTIPYPIVLGNRKIAAQLDELSMLPSTYFFDPEGKPAARQIGIMTRTEIEAFINAY
jgi:thiol-disulfide isomerase/thioredoxin